MRVLVINWQDWTHPRAGGAEQHLKEVFGRLARLGHPVDLLCAAYPGAASEERLEDITVIRRGRRYELFNATVPGIYRRVLHRNRYDVIVDDLNKVPFFSPLFTHRPVVALVHHLFGRTVFEETNPLFGSYVWLSELPVASVYRRSPFIAVSQSTADDLVARGVSEERIAVIPNGLPEAPYEGATYEEVVARPKSAKPLFVFLSRLKRYKRVELILDGFARLLEDHPRSQLVIAGDGDHREALERRAVELELGKRVRFPGWIADQRKWQLLRRAWALCYTSPKEGWGISSLEAQRVGTIAIVSDAPGLRDTVVDGETGEVVPHGDPAALAAAMARAIDHPEERERREAAAIRRAQKFSWDAAAEKTLGVLRRAARQAP
ncbi:MAG TPA: glycosyltransferase family 4 protein [Gemmatimonadota bacterium]|nr:glycosyltransferase family 4 protein [Gemmatimonadota bacterium]